MTNYIFCFILQFISVYATAQTVVGNLYQLANQEIKLEGFNGLTTYTVGKTTIDDQGNFSLRYSKSDIGVGYLLSEDNKPLFVILSGEDIALQGEALSALESLKITKGDENKSFETYAKDHPKRAQALSAWVYLDKMYASDEFFSAQKTPSQAIQNEILRINREDSDFLASLPNNSYVSWFIPARKLVSSVAEVAQYRTDEIPATIAAFRALDYIDPRLYKSGLFKDAMEGHFWLLENSGKSLDSTAFEMKKSIDALMKNLVKDQKKLNEVTDYLFNLLEEHSLVHASEYLAVSVLNQSTCTINGDLAKQLETYRRMKKGNIAPEMVFDEGFFANPSLTISAIADLKSKNTLVVFGASWCPKCKEEIKEMVSFYERWKAKGLEVVFISLDEDTKSFMDFASKFPFSAYCDLKKWNSKNVTNYYVFATPTMFLLNDKREIVFRPSSLMQVDTWLNTP